MTPNRHMLGLAPVLALHPMAALAHPGAGAHVDALHGLLHPLTGLDHILAMLAVGIFAAQLGGRSLWAVPGAFVLAMVAGAALGFVGMPLPLVEPVIAGSVVVLGCVVAMGARVPLAPAMALVASFAVFHGHAHGAEGAATAAFPGHAAGFVLATGALHLAGILLGGALTRLGGARPLQARRLIGAGGALAGALLLVG